MANQACKLIFRIHQALHVLHFHFRSSDGSPQANETPPDRILISRLMLAPYHLCKWQPLNRTPQTLWVPPSHTFITPGQISLLLQSLLPRSDVLHTSLEPVYDLRWQPGTSWLAEDINTHKCNTDAFWFSVSHVADHDRRVKKNNCQDWIVMRARYCRVYSTAQHCTLNDEKWTIATVMGLYFFFPQLQIFTGDWLLDH